MFKAFFYFDKSDLGYSSNVIESKNCKILENA